MLIGLKQELGNEAIQRLHTRVFAEKDVSESLYACMSASRHRQYMRTQIPLRLRTLISFLFSPATMLTSFNLSISSLAAMAENHLLLRFLRKSREHTSQRDESASAGVLAGQVHEQHTLSIRVLGGVQGWNRALVCNNKLSSSVGKRRSEDHPTPPPTEPPTPPHKLISFVC